jgi:class 3 adenylate cyclase
MDSKTQHGYLVLADISGYTSYLAKVELEHAHEILTDLLKTIVAQFKPLLTIAKLEGDAVFAYVEEMRVTRGETLLELVENTYTAFRNRRDLSQRNTTCTCNACRNIPVLDLKFFIHHGDFIVQNVSGIRELVGSDVNLAHRLMKNHITEATGWKAYALFTDEGLEHMHLRPEGLHEQVETYEHLGAVQTLSLDLHPRYQQMITARRVMITPENADFTFRFDFDAPPHIIWEWLGDIQRRNQAGGGHMIFTTLSRPGGRSGSGAASHCAHGEGLKNALIETILDWRPFEYFTTETVEGKGINRTTFYLEPAPNGTGTRLTTNMELISMSLPRWIKRPLAGLVLSKNNPYLSWYGAIAQLTKPASDFSAE